MEHSTFGMDLLNCITFGVAGTLITDVFESVFFVLCRCHILTLPTVLTLHCTYNTIITYTIADMIYDTTVTYATTTHNTIVSYTTDTIHHTVT